MPLGIGAESRRRRQDRLRDRARQVFPGNRRMFGTRAVLSYVAARRADVSLQGHDTRGLDVPRRIHPAFLMAYPKSSGIDLSMGSIGDP